MKKRALISVYDKQGVVEFAQALVSKYNYEIISTGGTAELLKKNNVQVTEITELTKFPEMLEGRVKTLHPNVHAGLLARRDKPEHMGAIRDLNISPIDMVVINLYPFQQIVAKPKVSLEEAIENIDIGGPSMLRSAAKNYSSVTVVSDISDYEVVLECLSKNNGETTLPLREQLATKTFKLTSKYDSSISSFLSNAFPDDEQEQKNGSRNIFEDKLNINLSLKKTLRYGENPHQQAALYVLDNLSTGLANAEVVQGKELSFNNYLDLESVWNIVSEFNAETPVAAIVKHNNPCGVAIAPNLLYAYAEALSADPVSAFGGIVGFNKKVDQDLAAELTKIFLEAVIAPEYSEEALKQFASKPKLRVLKISTKSTTLKNYDFKSVGQGYLVQDLNIETVNPASLKVVTKKKPTEQDMIDLLFAWKVCKHVKSNAIVIAKEGKTIGIGAGQTSRVASVEIALNQANYNAKNSCLASDAFFPFKDSIEIAASAQVSAIIQPGGSINDKEVIDACDKHDIAMVFTGMRHFRH